MENKYDLTHHNATQYVR